MVDPHKAAACWFDDVSIEPLGAGHIHDTYLVELVEPSATTRPRYVLQRISTEVYADPRLVMDQTLRVTHHLKDHFAFAVPQFVASQRQQMVEPVGKSMWRVAQYVEDSSVVDPIENVVQAAAAARAYGSFQKSLIGLPGPRLVETIPGFLQLRHYLERFDEVAHLAPKEQLELVVRHRSMAESLVVNNCYIHGDCKVNNLLFDVDRTRVVAVIDLDNVMYGHWAWDFGDLVRSVSFSRGCVEMDLFAACLRGFIAGRGVEGLATKDAVTAPAYVALMLAVRFLTDHLSGDRYFRVHEPGENLKRSNEQFALFNEFLAKQVQMLRVANKIVEAS